MNAFNIDTLDSSDYDIEAIEIDINNNNFEIARLDEYLHINIIKVSLINGQRKQAHSHALKHRFNIDFIELELAE